MEQPSQEEESRPQKTFIHKFRVKITIFFILFLIVYFAYLEWQTLIEILRQLPLFNSLYSLIHTHFVNKTLLGMFLSSSLGSLFFVFLPLEAQFAYYINSPFNIYLIAVILIVGNLIGLFINYLCGRLFGKPIAVKLLKDKYEKYENIFHRFGGVTILIGNALFFPIEIFSLLVGSLKYPTKRFILFTLLGKFLKFSFLIYVVVYVGTTNIEISSIL